MNIDIPDNKHDGLFPEEGVSDDIRPRVKVERNTIPLFQAKFDSTRLHRLVALILPSKSLESKGELATF